jgi:hypothetical protein
LWVAAEQNRQMQTVIWFYHLRLSDIFGSLRGTVKKSVKVIFLSFKQPIQQ